MADFVSVRGLWKTHIPRGAMGGRGAPVQAVRGVDLAIERNEVLGLVGESGSGKTSLGKAILYLDPPDEGSVRVADMNPAALSGKALRRFRRNCQIVFQDPTSALNPRLSVEHSIAEALANQGVPRAERRERVAHLLELTGITPRHMRRRPGEFSGGQKQRIVIARALATDPAFLVLDEPVSNLDVSIQAQIINLLLDLKERLSLTYLFISHDLNVIGYVSDRIAVMKDGEIVEQGAAAEIIERPTHPYTRTLFADAPVFHDPRSEPYAQ